MLTSFNGQTITYDEIGNPLQYRDGISFTWAKGRQLQGITKDGLNASYTYDENGLRISKTVNGITTKIFRTNGQMVGMNMSDGKDMTFMLDGDGKVYGVHYDHYSFDQLCSSTYYFAFNAQGDVIGIYDFDGRMIATYDYDEWGNCTVHALSTDRNGHEVGSPDHIAYVNPFRYRGYFYDAETGFYYLNSRYYDPGTGRFVNADGELSEVGGSILGYNLFAYCFNGPVNMDDLTGEWPKWLSGALNVVGGALQIAAGATLGATVGWTGFGAVVAGFLIVNGTSTVLQGVGKIVNAVTNSNVMREDNIVRTGVQNVGRTIGGSTGAKIAGGVYDIAVVAANLYSGKVNLENSMPKIINSKLFEINNGYGIKIGQTAKASYGYINLLYQNPSFTEQYGIRGGTFVSINNSKGDCIFRIDWDPKDGLHIQ